MRKNYRTRTIKARLQTSFEQRLKAFKIIVFSHKNTFKYLCNSLEMNIFTKYLGGICCINIAAIFVIKQSSLRVFFIIAYHPLLLLSSARL